MKTIIHNPIIWADVPDVDVIRIQDIFYMISTSMHTMPGCPIMKSKDLVHWEIINYVFDILEDSIEHNLEDNKGIYGQGSWAPSLRYHKGKFYVCFTCNDTNSFYIYSTEDIENGKWNRIAKVNQLLHDPALIFDEDIPYILYGCGDIKIIELKEDLSGIKEGGVSKVLFQTPREGIGLRCEGGHAYKINHMYYFLYIEWPSTGSRRRREVCYRSKSLFGPYERKVIFDDDMGYHNKGIAQGAIFDDLDGNWYAMLFQDHDAVGRIPYVLPVTWEDEWPMIGVNGKAVESFEVPFKEDIKENSEKGHIQKDNRKREGEKYNYTKIASHISISDNFEYSKNKLALNWQWNHNPNSAFWSVTERSGYLRLRVGSLTSKGVLYARNTLTQRTVGPVCTGISKLELTGMNEGDCAGLLALQSNFGFVGVRITNGLKYVVMCVNNGNNEEREIEAIPYYKEYIYLKIHFNFLESIDIATFYFSDNGKNWINIGSDLQMKYTLDHFMGYRMGLFCYGEKELGGYTDFDYFQFLT